MKVSSQRDSIFKGLIYSSLTASSYLRAPVCRECRLMGAGNVAAIEAVCFPSSFRSSRPRTRDCRLSAVAVFHSTRDIRLYTDDNPDERIPWRINNRTT